MGLGSIRVGWFGWTNEFGLTLPPLIPIQKYTTFCIMQSQQHNVWYHISTMIQISTRFINKLHIK